MTRNNTVIVRCFPSPQTISDRQSYLRAPIALPSMSRYSGLRPLVLRLVNANPRASTLPTTMGLKCNEVGVGWWESAVSKQVGGQISSPFFSYFCCPPPPSGVWFSNFESKSTRGLLYIIHINDERRNDGTKKTKYRRALHCKREGNILALYYRWARKPIWRSER